MITVRLTEREILAAIEQAAKEKDRDLGAVTQIHMAREVGPGGGRAWRASVKGAFRNNLKRRKDA